MLENNCSDIDLQIAKLLDKDKYQNEGFQQYTVAVKKLVSLETEISKLKDEVQFLTDAIQIQVLHNPDNADIIKNLYQERLGELQNEMDEKVCLY